MSLFRNRNFSILLLGQLVSIFGNNLFIIALPWYVYAQTGSKLALAWTGMAQTLPVLAGLFVGVFVDRWSKRRTMVQSDLIRTVLSVLQFWLASVHVSLWLLLILVLLSQFIGTFFAPASSSLIPLLVEEAEIPAATGLNQTTSAAAELVGMLSGGALITLLGAPLLFLVNGLTFLVSVLSLLFVRVAEPAAARPTSSAQQEWLDGIKAILHSKIVLRITIGALVANFAFAPFDILLTVWVKNVLREQAFAFGLIEGAIAFGVMIGGALLGYVSKKVQLKQILTLGLMVMGLGILLVGALPNLYWDISMVLLAGLAMGFVNGSFGAVAMQMVPQTMLGRVFGTLTALSTLAIPAGIGLFGWLMQFTPIGLLFLMMGIPSVLSGASFLIKMQENQQHNEAQETVPKAISDGS